MGRIAFVCLASLALAVSACASGDAGGDLDASSAPDAAVGADIDSGASAADADTSAPDAATAPDAAAVPDAEPPLPDADPAAPPTVLGLTPATGSIAGGETVTVAGNNFFADVQISFGGTTAVCSYETPARVTCTTPAAGAVGAVGVTATQTSGSHTLPAGFLYWDAGGGVDDCNLVPPTSLDVVAGRAQTWQARVFEPTITDATTGSDVSALLRGQLGYGPLGTDPTTAPGWTWFELTADGSYGPGSGTYVANYDQYGYAGTVPSRARYTWSARFTVEDGARWKFCGTGTMTSRLPIACAADGNCYADEKCLSGLCRVDCANNDDCKAWGPYCTGIGTMTDGSTLELYCDPGNPGEGVNGAACTGDGDCTSGLCLNGLSDTCTVGCGISDAECASAAGNVCTEFSGLGLCAPSCGATSNCTAGHVCILNQNDGQNRYDTLCLQPSDGAVANGNPCGDPIACESGICLTGPNLCTAPCNSNADCPTSLPTCGTGTITRPNGVGTQSIPICVD